jgi:uncharacterized protein (DUF885 family)
MQFGEKLMPPLKATVSTIAIALTAAATMVASAPGAAVPPPTISVPVVSPFEGVANRYIGSLARFSPTYATTLGNHSYDHLLPDVSAAGRAAEMTEWRGLLAALARIEPASLNPETQVDYAMLKNDLEYRIWSNDVLQDWAWDPQYYNSVMGGSLYGLAARDFAPWDVRLKAATARMEAIPRFIAESRRQLVPARVPKVFAETVAKQNEGIIEIAETMLAPHKDVLNPSDKARFEAALQNLKAVVWEHQQWLEKTLVPQAAGEFRLGAERYDQKMKFALMSDLTRPELKAAALKAKADARAEMYGLAQQVLAGKTDLALPANPSAEQQQAAIEAALQLTYAVRPPRERLEERARETLAEATAFVREKGFIRMPDGPVKVITMPVFQQGFSVAYNDAPGALEKHLDNFYAVSPVPADWTDEQATSFLSEYNDYMIHDLSIHEAMPGHYLQLDHSNRSPSTLRAILGSGPFVEGWAVYAEGVMKDEGYLNGDPLFKLTVLKMRLRSITNTLLDIGIQTEGMTRDQAMELMQQGAFQQEREAAGKWIRASLSSTQLLSYFTGYEEHRRLRAEAEQRWGKEFTLRRYHDTVLSFGSPPVKYARALMFGLPIK